MIKNFFHKNEQIAILIKNNYENEGIKFFTSDDSPLQVAFMSHKKNHVIDAHIHNVVERKISLTQEVLIIKKGKLRLDLYSKEKEYLESTILQEGDIVFLAHGGHGLVCLEDANFIEVKQGPYLGENDKVRFNSLNKDSVVINE